MKQRVSVIAMVMVALAALLALAQGQRPASPPGTAAVQVGGKYVQDPNGQSYQDGKWIEVTQSQPWRT